MFLSTELSRQLLSGLLGPDDRLVYGDVELIDEELRVTGIDVQGPFDLAMYFGRMIYVPRPGASFRVRRLRQLADGAASSAIRRMRTSGFDSRSAFQSVN